MRRFRIHIPSDPDPDATRTHTARGSEKTSAWMCIIRSPPAVYSMTKHTCSGVWKHANRLTKNGWWEPLTVSKIRFSHMRLETDGQRAKGQGPGGSDGWAVGGSDEHDTVVTIRRCIYKVDELRHQAAVQSGIRLLAATFQPRPLPQCRPSSVL